MRWDAVAVGGALAAALAWRGRRDQDRALAWRAQLLDDCSPLLTRSDGRVDRAGWPLLDGEFEGMPAQVSLILDDAGYRKLPVLWLSVTLTASLSMAASFDALAREQGTEFYSPAGELPVRLALPAEWPPHVSLRADRPAALPAALASAGARYFATLEAKEIVVSARGVRLVRFAAEGRRAEYLVLRRSHFELARIDPAVVRAQLAAAVQLVRALAAGADDAGRRAA
jgi:hypothetical protein